MKDCAVLFTHADQEYGILFDFEAYLALERRHGLTIAKFSRLLAETSAVAAQAGMLEGLEGYRRTFGKPSQSYEVADVAKVVFGVGVIETCPMLARAMAATYRREKGLGKDAEKKAPADQTTS